MFQRNEKDDGGYLEVSTYSDLCPVRGIVEQKVHDIPTRKTIEELIGLMVEGDHEIKTELLRYVEAMSEALNEQRDALKLLADTSSSLTENLTDINQSFNARLEILEDRC